MEFIKIDTRAIKQAFAERQKAVDDAVKGALSESARTLASNARRRTRVYGGSSAVKLSAVKKARRAGVTLSGAKLKKGQSVEAAGQVVAGLLRDSIRPGRVVKVLDMHSVKIYPGGPRAHLYASKIEALDHMMSEALAETALKIPDIHAAAVRKVFH